MRLPMPGQVAGRTVTFSTIRTLTFFVRCCRRRRRKRFRHMLQYLNIVVFLILINIHLYQQIKHRLKFQMIGRPETDEISDKR